MMEEIKEERDPWITATAVHVVCSSENGDIQVNILKLISISLSTLMSHYGY